MYSEGNLYMRDTLKRQFTPTEEAIILLLSASLFGARQQELPDIQPDQLFEEAEKQSVFPQVYQALSQQDARAVEQKWTDRFHRHIAHNVNIIYQHFQAHELMTEAGIPYSVMKGCASAYYYAEPELRTMGDVDLFVEQSSMEAVRAHLCENGFSVSGLHHSHHWTFTRDDEVYEVHWTPSGVPVEDHRHIRAQFDDLLQKRRLVEFQDGALYLPDECHHGLILLLHTANHLSAGGIGLRHLMDWLVFVNSMPEELFVEKFDGVLRQLGLWQFVKVLTAVGTHYFSCPPRAFCADISPELSGSILLDIFSGGNFGVKDSGRLMESKLLRDEQTREIDEKGRVRHIVRFLNRKARLALPASEKHPILLPVGWMIVGRKHFRHKSRTKEKSVSLFRVAKSAKEREKLYKQLRLFED